MSARRVMFAYDQCLLCLSHHPDVWYEAALFLENISKLMNEKGVGFKNFLESSNISIGLVFCICCNDLFSYK